MSSALRPIDHTQEILASYINPETLPWIDWSEGNQIKLLRLNPASGQIVFFIKSKPDAVLPIHFHPGTVVVYTVQGSWTYGEGWDAHKGDVVYETAGSIHEPRMLPGEEDVIVFAVVEGALMFQDSNGALSVVENWQTLLQRYHDHCEKHGIIKQCITF